MSVRRPVLPHCLFSERTSAASKLEASSLISASASTATRDPQATGRTLRLTRLSAQRNTNLLTYCTPLQEGLTTGVKNCTHNSLEMRPTTNTIHTLSKELIGCSRTKNKSVRKECVLYGKGNRNNTMKMFSNRYKDSLYCTNVQSSYDAIKMERGVQGSDRSVLLGVTWVCIHSLREI
ncbi:hypothetical protein TRVL_07983 [Trypanosoma vivax]|uniref:Uncharacterized protein n=1 Tax=Trypanosoma vivax (strain Y486) TaxID=1055687 RepID=G0TYD8_TRYVY|nr:hypothetical protein TRVL_07983 [Trypanosoma vivax]CCC48985.1 hypothetical protein, unlikely [Trypanosoma vivax Y486]